MHGLCIPLPCEHRLNGEPQEQSAVTVIGRGPSAIFSCGRRRLRLRVFEFSFVESNGAPHAAVLEQVLAGTKGEKEPQRLAHIPINEVGLPSSVFVPATGSAGGMSPREKPPFPQVVLKALRRNRVCACACCGGL